MGLAKKILTGEIDDRTPEQKVTDLWEKYVGADVGPVHDDFGLDLPFGWDQVEDLYYKIGDVGLTEEDIEIIDQMSEEAFNEFLGETLWRQERFLKDD
jgi:hypothetical protein